jgi:hypothetical protein
MITFLFGLLTGIIFSFLGIFGWVMYEYFKAAEEAHRDGYENPYL